MLLPNLILLIEVTFSTPTPGCNTYPLVGFPLLSPTVVRAAFRPFVSDRLPQT